MSVKWPVFMGLLASDPSLWDEVMLKVRAQPGESIPGLERDLQQFLWNTRYVAPEVDIRPWLYLRQGTSDASLRVKIEGVLQNGASKEFLDLVSDSSMKDKKGEILRVVSSIMRHWQNTNRRVFLRNGVPVMLSATLIVPEDRELRKDALRVVDYLASSATPEELEQLFDFTDVLSIISEAPQWQRHKIIPKYVALFDGQFADTPRRMEVWKQLIANSKLLETGDKETISSALLQRYSSSIASGEDAVLSILQFIEEDIPNRGWAVTHGLINSIVYAIKFDRTDADRKRVNALVAFKKYPVSEAKKALLLKIDKTLDPSVTENTEVAIKSALNALERLGPDFFRSNAVDMVAATLIAQANSTDVADAGIWLSSLVHWYPILPERYLKDLDPMFERMFVDADPDDTISLLGTLSPEVRAELLTIGQLDPILRSQSAEYHRRFADEACERREQILQNFDIAQLLDHIEIFDDAISWDLALLINFVDRAVMEQKIDIAEAVKLLDNLSRKYLPRLLKSQEEFYARLVQFVTKYPSATSSGLADTAALCELARIKQAVDYSYPDFVRFKRQLPPDRRLELIRDLFPMFTSRSDSWVELLGLAVEDVRNDEVLRSNPALTNDLADYAFFAAREEWLIANRVLEISVSMLGLTSQQDYVDRALEALLSLADTDELAKMEPLLNLVTIYAQHASGPVAVKLIKFIQRMLGAAHPDSAKVRVLQLASHFESSVLRPVRENLEQLRHSDTPEVASLATTIVERLDSK